MSRTDELLAEIRGTPMFCILPVRLRRGAGFFADGWAWLRWVTKRRHIGFPSFYYTDEE